MILQPYIAPPPDLRIQSFPNKFNFMRLKAFQFIKKASHPKAIALTLCCRYWAYRDNNLLRSRGLIRKRYRLRRFRRTMNAAFAFRNVTHFIKGSKYWRLSGNQNRRNSPKIIRPQRLRNADAVTTWINSNRIYVFKGESYYRLGKVNKEPYYRFGKVNRGERNPKSIATRWMRCDGGVGTTEP